MPTLQVLDCCFPLLAQDIKVKLDDGREISIPAGSKRLKVPLVDGSGVFVSFYNGSIFPLRTHDIKLVPSQIEDIVAKLGGNSTPPEQNIYNTPPPSAVYGVAQR